MKDNTNIKKTSAPPKLVALPPPPEPALISLQAFPDTGEFLKSTPHPSGNSVAILGFTVGNKVIQVAGTPYPAIAELLCAGVNTLQAAARLNQQQQQQPDATKTQSPSNPS